MLADGDTEGEMDALGLALADGLPDALGDAVGLVDGDGLPDPDGLTDNDGDGDGDWVLLPLPDGDGDMDGDPNSKSSGASMTANATLTILSVCQAISRSSLLRITRRRKHSQRRLVNVGTVLSSCSRSSSPLPTALTIRRVVTVLSL